MVTRTGKARVVHWLRPDFQRTAVEAVPVQIEIEAAEETAIAGQRMPWPKELPDQLRALAQALSAAKVPLSEAAIAERFAGRGSWKKRLPQLVDSLVSLGRARRVKDGVLGIG